MNIFKKVAIDGEPSIVLENVEAETVTEVEAETVTEVEVETVTEVEADVINPSEPLTPEEYYKKQFKDAENSATE